MELCKILLLLVSMKSRKVYGLFEWTAILLRESCLKMAPYIQMNNRMRGSSYWFCSTKNPFRLLVSGSLLTHFSFALCFLAFFPFYTHGYHFYIPPDSGYCFVHCFCSCHFPIYQMLCKSEYIVTHQPGSMESLFCRAYDILLVKKSKLT